MEVIVNGTIYNVKNGTPLKEVLFSYGASFPCGGKGHCGKCRVQCKELAPTALDERFLSKNAIDDGWRIACDKIIESDLVMTCEKSNAAEKKRELAACNIAATIGVRTIEIGILDDEIAEKITVINPLYDGNGLEGIAKRYCEDKITVTNALRAVLGKESIELFEKYNKAKAETFAIATNGTFARILLGEELDAKIDDYNACVDGNNLSLPTETVYFLPIVDAYVGGDILCESVNYPENTMLIDCEEVFCIVSIGKEDTVVASMWDVDYDEIGLRAIRAAIKTMRPDGYTPFVRLYGTYKEKLEEILIEEGLTYAFCEKELDNVASACVMLRYRTKLNKERARTSIFNLLSNERFHDYFAE